jgi:hypothetical protein
MTEQITSTDPTTTLADSTTTPVDPTITPTNQTDTGAPSKSKRKPRKERKFPPLTFEEALRLAEAIQRYAAGQKIRRLTLFEKLDESPDNAQSRKMITASSQYGLTKGSYTAEYLELTPEGTEATAEDIAPEKKLKTRFSLAIERHSPFEFLYQKLNGNKLPAKEVLADLLSEVNVEDDEKAECIDTFILNVTFLGLLRTIGGAERLVPIDQALEESPAATQTKNPGAKETASLGIAAAPPVHALPVVDNGFSAICFYITPIGDETSEQREHADFMMDYVIGPALKEFDLKVVRADSIGTPGMIGKQVVEHILKSRLVIADLSFHNPNVFYELCLRHTTRLPTVQIIRAADKIPFDLNQYRTIPIDTRNVYTLYPKLQTYSAQVANQVRRALENSESGDNPISLYYPSAKLNWENK